MRELNARNPGLKDLSPGPDEPTGPFRCAGTAILPEALAANLDELERQSHSETLIAQKVIL